MKILMLETMTYGDDISLEQFNRLGEVVTYSLSSYEEAVARIDTMSDFFKNSSSSYLSYGTS